MEPQGAIEQLLTRGVSELIGAETLKARLASGEKLRIKFGVDPTSPHLHLGRSVPILKLRDFQEQGHTIVLIVGDFTGIIGDTSDKESERPMLTREVIEENMRTYTAQAGALIDMERVEFHHNSEWLETLGYREIGEHANRFSVADFIARDTIKKRLDAGKRVSLREVLYPLMQGYDSVAVRADVELGGNDQRFNLLAGRTLQEACGQAPQTVIMNPLIPGTDGRKMSSSWGNTINLDDDPHDMYGKVMSVHDDLIVQYFGLCTRVPLEDVRAVEAGLSQGSLHPKDAKMRLAHSVVALYHGSEAAARAEEDFVHTFQQGGLPDAMASIEARPGAGLGDVLMGAGLVGSKGEWRRLVQGGGVHTIDDRGAPSTLSDDAHKIHCTTVVKLGKRRFAKITLTQAQ